MISYSQKIIFLLMSMKGSIIPSAIGWAVPCATLAALVKFLIQHFEYEVKATPGGVLTTVAGFITMLSFMMAFRANQAFSRYWEGAELVQQTRGVWQNAMSSFSCFCSEDPKKEEDVKKIKNQIIRLMSLLFSTALGALAEGDEFEAFGIEDLDGSKLAILDNDFFDEDNRCELILSWIQTTVMRGQRAGIVDAPPPIVSRVFQELGDGMVRVCNAKKINEIQYPFMMAQLLAVMLVCYSVGVALGTGYTMSSMATAAASTFLNVCALWCVHYASVAIEAPFGTKLSSLPMQAEMVRMNKCLSLLVSDEARIVPNILIQDQAANKFRDMVADAERKIAPDSPQSSRSRRTLISKTPTA
eukprot:TRINITY_DN10286_c0_g1_i8.p1 TRINITY_DN10286_c0_g1~~TRINITY_DN10286_c0_g1_i8.p1  ORF type:complete len:387 (-),score=76.20 TRINITY_DN10286_c0_g1_i8:118-1191(-)